MMARSSPSFRLPEGSLIFVVAFLCFSLSGALPLLWADDTFHYFEAEGKPVFHLSGSHTVGIIPFVNMTGDEDNDWVGEAMTSALVEMIERGGGCVRLIDEDVLGEERKAYGKKIDLAELERRMVRSLGIQAILWCEYRRSTGGVFRFSCRLHEPGRVSEGSTISECGKMEEILEVQDRLSEKICARLGLTPPGKETQRKVGVKAYEYFQRALASPDGSYRRLHFCLKALEEDPEYVEARLSLAEAYYIIGISYGNQECLDRALSEYGEVIGLDPHHSKAHYMMAMISFIKGDYKRSRREFERALELCPGMAEAKLGLKRLAEVDVR